MRKTMFIVLLAVLVACAPLEGGAESHSKKKFTIRAFQFGFDPAKIEVNVGDKVIINAYTDDVPHGLAIPEFGIDMALMSKDIVTAEFVADKPGTFSFYCSIPCGEGHGSMKGQLIVKE